MVPQFIVTVPLVAIFVMGLLLLNSSQRRSLGEFAGAVMTLSAPLTYLTLLLMENIP